MLNVKCIHMHIAVIAVNPANFVNPVQKKRTSCGIAICEEQLESRTIVVIFAANASQGGCMMWGAINVSVAAN